MKTKTEYVAKKLEEPDLTLDYLEVQRLGKTLRYVNSNRVSEKRVKTLEEKEPTTLAWIESFGKDDVYFDVGGNVGMYAIYAGVMAGCRVYAFEPESLNYADLNKNIHLNGLHERVTAYCCAISNEQAMSVLHLSRFAQSYSHHDFKDNRWEGPVVHLGPSMEARPKQGCFSFKLDDLVYCQSGSLPQPNHIKIDVDGYENRVVEGAWQTINNPSTKTVLLEVDFSLPNSVALLDRFTAAGWKTSKEQVRTNRYGVMSGKEYAKMVDEKKGGANHIFFRDDAYAKLFADFAASWRM